MDNSELIIRFQEEINDFLSRRYEIQNCAVPQKPFIPIFKKPEDFNFQELLKVSSDDRNFGYYLANIETAFLDYQTLGEPIIFDPNTDGDFKKWCDINKKRKIDSHQLSNMSTKLLLMSIIFLGLSIKNTLKIFSPRAKKRKFQTFLKKVIFTIFQGFFLEQM